MLYPTKSARCAVSLLMTTVLAVPAMAQGDPSFPPGTITLQRDPNDPSTLLNRYLRVLSTNPNAIDALLGAGRAALALGDANAAIGFFGRAEAAEPRNGRAKAGLGAAAVQQAQAARALQLFDQAIALGVPAAEIGGDRGLAYDLRGQNRLAQADYRAALTQKKDDEITRRLALSTAIGGDRAGGMAILDPLLRRQDKAAWRASTFILAMTGDPEGATRRANQLMAPTQAAAMTPYLRRLATLSPSEKAAAVHFGRFPVVNDTRTAAVAAPVVARPAAVVAPVRTSTAVMPTAPVATAVTTAPVAPPVRSAEAAVARPVVAAPIRTTAIPASVAAPVAIAAASVAGPATASARQPVGTSFAAAPSGETRPAIMPAPVAQGVVRQVQATFAPLVSSPAPAAAVDGGVDTVRMVTAPAPVVAMRQVAPIVRPTPDPVVMPPTPGAVAASGDTVRMVTTAKPPVRAVVAERAAAVVKAAPVRVATRTIGGTPADAAELDALRSMVTEPKRGTARATRKGTALVADEGEASTRGRTAAGRKGAVETAADVSETPEPATKGATTRRGRADAAKADAVAAKAGTRKGRTDSVDTEVAAKGAKGRIAAKGKAGSDEDAAEDDTGGKTRTAGKSGKAATKAEALAATKAKAKAAKVPERYWVQVAGGANKATLPKAWSGVKAKHSTLLAGRTAYTAPLRYTNRLLIGPFKSDEEAQAFVNKAGGSGLNAFSYTSPAGQDVEKLPAR